MAHRQKNSQSGVGYKLDWMVKNKIRGDKDGFPSKKRAEDAVGGDGRDEGRDKDFMFHVHTFVEDFRGEEGPCQRGMKNCPNPCGHPGRHQGAPFMTAQTQTGTKHRGKSRANLRDWPLPAGRTSSAKGDGR